MKTSVRFIVLAVAILVLGGSLTVAEEPAKKPADKKTDAKDGSPEKTRKSSGYSLAPRESGKGKTSLFGVTGEGYKFVYVFDRSGSMGAKGRESLKAVKVELLRSLKDLRSVHQFQIIYYNERPSIFNPTGDADRLAFATDENKDRAVRFIESISAGGGTDHEQALKLAIRLQPNVIFFLTDADDPKLTPAQLEKIQRMASGIVINAIEFGPGPKPEGDSFLVDLAKQNGGGYAYVDISKREAGH
jgi:hypothetical protein